MDAHTFPDNIIIAACNVIGIVISVMVSAAVASLFRIHALILAAQCFVIKHLQFTLCTQRKMDNQFDYLESKTDYAMLVFQL